MDEAEHLHMQIEQAQEDLKQDLQALQTKASEVVDWRAQFEKRPLLMIGLAFGGGLIASSLLGGRPSRRREITESQPIGFSAPQRPSAASESFRNVRNTLAALAGVVALDLVHEAVPGLKEKLDRARERVAQSAAKTDGRAPNAGPGGTERAAPAQMFHSADAR